MIPDDLTPDQAERLQAALLAYADGALGEMDQARLDRLLAADPQLRQRLATLRQRGTRLQDMLSQRPAPRSLSAERRAAVLAAADEGIRRRRLRGRRLPWEQIVFEAAVLLVCVGGALIVVVGGSSKSFSIAVAEIPPPTADYQGEAAADQTLAESSGRYGIDATGDHPTEERPAVADSGGADRGAEVWQEDEVRQRVVHLREGKTYQLPSSALNQGQGHDRYTEEALTKNNVKYRVDGREGVFALPSSGERRHSSTGKDRDRQIIEVETDIEAEAVVEDATIVELDLEVTELATEDPVEEEPVVSGREEADLVSEMGGPGAFAQIGAGKGTSGAFGRFDDADDEATTTRDIGRVKSFRYRSDKDVPSAAASDIVSDLAVAGDDLVAGRATQGEAKHARPGRMRLSDGRPVEEGQGWPSGIAEFPGPELEIPAVTSSRVPRLEEVADRAQGRLFAEPDSTSDHLAVEGVGGGPASIRESRPFSRKIMEMDDGLGSESIVLQVEPFRRTDLDDSMAAYSFDNPRYGGRVPEKRRQSVDEAGRAPVSADSTAPPTRSLPPLAPAEATGSDWRLAPPVGARPPVNPWVLTATDRLSTFALDTDSASLQLTSRSIREAVLPKAAQVRVEEFVNAFDYHYPSPSAATFGVQSRIGPSPWRAGTQVVQVGVKGRVIGRDRQRPMHLVVVLDASGSMQAPDRLPMLQRALHQLVERFGAQDRLSLVRFGGGTQILLEAASGADRAALHRAIDSVQADGSTDLLGGLRLGYELAQRSYTAGHMHRVLLCSDGVATIGSTSLDELVATVAERRRQGIACSTVGVGAGSYDDRVLEQLANRGDGGYHYLADETAIAELVAQLAASLQVIAYDAKIQVDFDPAVVRRYRLLGYENRAIADADFRNDSVDAGEVGSGESATALYEIELVDPQHPATIGAVGIRYRDVAAQQVREDRYALRYDPSWRPDPADQPYWYLAQVAAQFAELLRGSGAAPAVGLDKLAAVARRVRAALPHDARVAELCYLIEHVGGLPRRR